MNIEPGIYQPNKSCVESGIPFIEIKGQHNNDTSIQSNSSEYSENDTLYSKFITWIQNVKKIKYHYKECKSLCYLSMALAIIFVIALVTIIASTRAKDQHDQQLQKETEGHDIMQSVLDDDDSSLVAPGPYTSSKRNSDLVIVDIHYQLRIISSGTNAVIIKKLLSKSNTPSGLSNGCCNSVKNLTLAGPITANWLYYLLDNFSNLETLTVNVDGVSTHWEKKNNSSEGELRPTINLELLSELNVQNSHKWPIFQWGFNLSMPKLKIVSVSKATFYPQFFQVFQSVMNGSKDSIEGIEITESCICSDCDITALQFPNLQFLKITKRVEEERTAGISIY